MRKQHLYYLKLWAIIIILTLISSSFFPVLKGEASTSPNSKIEGMFVLDVSKSMDDSDPNKISQEAIKMFIDMSSVQGDKIGIVTYNDQVVRERAMLAISNQKDKQELKNFIDQLTHSGYTDISEGLNEATKLLDAGHTQDSVPFMILLADGINDLSGSKSGKTNTQANIDLQEAIKAIKQKKYPIYTIGLNGDGKLNKGLLENISKQTNGKFFTTNSASDLPAILSAIFADHLKLKVQNVGNFKANGSFQDVKINVPNASVAEANISIMSQKPVELKLVGADGKEIPIPSEKVVLSKSRKYSMVKIIKPQKGDWLLKVKGVKQDQIGVNLIFNYDLQLKTDPLQGPYKKGDTVKISSFLESNGEKVDSVELYRQMKATLIVTDKSTNQTSQIAMNNSGKGFDAAYTLQNENSLELKVRVEDNSFYRESDPMYVTLGEKAKAAGKTITKAKEDKPFPWTMVLIVLGLIIASIILFIVIRKLRGNRPTNMVGSFGIEVRNNDTYETEPPQYRELYSFGKKANFHQIIGFRDEFTETKAIVVQSANNGLRLINTSNMCTVELDGELLDSNKKANFNIGDAFTVTLSNINKTIIVRYID